GSHDAPITHEKSDGKGSPVVSGGPFVLPPLLLTSPRTARTVRHAFPESPRHAPRPVGGVLPALSHGRHPGRVHRDRGGHADEAPGSLASGDRILHRRALSPLGGEVGVRPL